MCLSNVGISGVSNAWLAMTSMLGGKKLCRSGHEREQEHEDKLEDGSSEARGQAKTPRGMRAGTRLPRLDRALRPPATRSPFLFPLPTHRRHSRAPIMTEEQQEDVKPKINLVVDFEGQSEPLSRPRARRDAPPLAPAAHSCSMLICLAPSPACTVKVKPGMAFKKLFEAAEVRLPAASPPPLPLISAL